MGTKFRRKTNKLPMPVYRRSGAYSLTLTCADRSPYFSEARLVTLCKDMLRSSAAKYGFEIVAYCFMPDHLHLLVHAGGNGFLPDFVKHF